MTQQFKLMGNQKFMLAFHFSQVIMQKVQNKPVREKTNSLCFRQGPTQLSLYKHRRWLESGNFGFRKKRNSTIRVAKTKALISFAVTAKLICVFVFAYANCWFSQAQAHFC